MGAKGFKGTEVSISKLQIQGKATGAVISFEVCFSDKDGIVHAITRHEVDASSTPRLHNAVKELVEAVGEWTTVVHFDTPDTNSKSKEAFRGIAEALTPADEAEGYERQG